LLVSSGSDLGQRGVTQLFQLVRHEERLQMLKELQS
jgi:hypothetical protein